VGTAELRAAATSRLTWAVALGLVIGKLAGIAGVTRGALGARAGRLPSGVGMNHVLGGSVLAGIGFTVSLFITGLAFSSAALQGQAKIGILGGSLLAGLLGTAVLSRVPALSEADVGPLGSGRE
jgi:Na+:H+ antiporter, NhaA family